MQRRLLTCICLLAMLVSTWPAPLGLAMSGPAAPQAAPQWRLAGFAGVGVYSVAFSPDYGHDRTIMLGSIQGVFRSRDAGATWQAVPNASALGAFTFSPGYATDQTIFAASSGIYRSTDGGSTWSLVGAAASTITCLVISPNYAADRTVFAGSGNGSIYRSTDGGATWTVLGPTMPGYGVRMVISPAYANDHTVFAGYAKAWDWYTGGVYKSTDGGLTWSAVNSGLTYREVHGLAISPKYDQDHTLWLTVWNGGVYRTTDGGGLWQEANLGQPNRRAEGFAISPNYAADHTLLLGTWGEYADGGVYMSTDSGTSWTYASAGLATHWIHVLAFSPTYVEDHVILAGGEQSNGGGLWSTAPRPITVSLAPLYPAPDRTSTIMQGGVLHRYFRALDAGGAPVPGLTVNFAPAGSGVTDAQGRLDAAIPADGLGGPGRYTITSTGATSGTVSYVLTAPVSFAVQVERRDLTSFWSSGAETRSRAGIGAGVKGYITGAHEGGLEARLAEQYPPSAGDDTLQLKASQTNEAGGGVGLGADAGFKLGPVKGSVEVGTESGLTWKALEEYVSQFNDPFASAQERAEAITALVGIYRTAQGFADTQSGMNLLGQIILRLLEQNPEYRTYLVEETGGVGVALDNSSDIGGKFDLLRFGKYSHGVRQSRFLHLQAGGEFTGKLDTLARWTTDPATNATRGLDWQEEVEGTAWGGLSGGLSYGTRLKLEREIGATYSVERSAGYDPALGTMAALTFTVSSEVRDEGRAGVDIDPRGPIDWGAIAGKQVQYQIQHRYLFTGPTLQAAMGRAPGLAQLNAVEQSASATNPLQLGQNAARRDLTALLGCSPTCLDGFAYEKWLEATTALQPGLDLGFSAFLKLEVGGNFKVEWGKEVLLERGVFIGGEYLPTETYGLDTYVDAPERGLWSLIGSAVRSAFSGIAGFFNSVAKQVQSGVDWVLDVVAPNVQGNIIGGLHLAAPGSIQGAGHTALDASGAFTLTATAWTPDVAPTARAQAQLLHVQTVDPGFVVGGVYDLQPYTATLNPAATAVITYSQAAITGRDEAQLRLYRWSPADWAWRPVSATMDAANHRATAQISTLGTFTIGFDNQPPAVDEVIPGADAPAATYRPQFRVMLHDAGSGIDPESVHLAVDGAQVAAVYQPVTGQLWYAPTVALANGSHTLRIAATDTAGNTMAETRPFTVSVPAPHIAGISPSVIAQGVTVTLTITGSGFYPGLALSVGPQPCAYAFLSAGAITATLPGSLPPGAYDVVAQNSDGQVGRLAAGLHISGIAAPAQAVISGPGRVLVGGEQPFTVTVAPPATSLPVTYIWQATGLPDVVHANSLSLADSVRLAWPARGTQTITVTATNSAGTAVGQYDVDVRTGLYLPILTRNQ